ncbi:hypothetical protein J0A68_07160 [Algoriphagus sp. H41]|uniref:Uncharacterized protein n=1 Tax=Algoriphagus oliviformis TaxID=2811231 RepID=A0ABS3C0W7_9BACT|nr:hypothetical protein [Algoriphagus oliviformis]MBN7810726.1 hypothetical protein [Algoriphagus oliviformis]
MISQKEILAHFLPLMEAQGKRFRKRSLIRAKKAKPGLEVVTLTSDGVETKNTAEKGDWLVENQTSAKESYLIKAETFEKKYILMHSLGEGWGCYRPVGEVYAYKVSEEDLGKFGAGEVMEFQAPWKESIVVKTGDFLVAPTDKSEIYRVAKKEFGETYEAIKE